MTSERALVRRLAELVSFDTQNPAGDERPLADRLAKELHALGAAHVDTFLTGRHASVFARFGSTPPKLLLNAHIDTVPANAGWHRPPHTLFEENGRCYGLGSADTKGAAAAILEAIGVLRVAGKSPDGVAVLFSGDEERGGTCVRAFLDSGRAAGIERAIACEPTSCRVGVRHRGIAAAEIGATSPGGHSSRADDLPAPVVTLARVAVALDAMGKRYRDEGPAGFKGLCFNVAALDGGLAFNVIPARATLSFSIRPAPGADTVALLREAEGEARRAAAPDDVTWRVDHLNPPFATRDVDRFRVLLEARGEAPLDLAFWTEAALFADKGIDAVVFGPGAIEQAHAADEFVEVSELVLARDTFVRLLSG